MSGWGETVARIAIPLAVIAVLVWLSFRPRRPTAVPDGPAGEPYRVYTRDYDLELKADQVVARLSSASRDAGSGHFAGAAAWADAASDMEALLAEQRAAIDFDAALADLRSVSPTMDPRDLVITLLIDQSGSMKGSPIAWAAVAATLVADLANRFGARIEILGFSSAGWRGGHARAQWLENGRPARPGRLCALMHVIYKSATESALGNEARRVMVHPDLLRENVDGEAILWARDRLLNRPERHKLLVVISDGAPVDDSTLQANGPNYLFRHMKAVLNDVEADTRLTIGGVGIAHDVEAYYWLATTALTPADVKDAVFRLLAQMMAETASRTGPEIE